MLADESVRAATARAGKAAARDEREELPPVPRKSNDSFALEDGPIQGAAMVAPASVKAARVTGIRPAPVPLQGTTTLSWVAKKPAEKSTPDKQSASEELEYREEEHELTPVRTVTERTF